MSEDRTAQARQMAEAAKRADWTQVVLNGGPPCFALNVDGNGTFCLRAHRWAGHGQGEWPMHEFVSLADLIAALTSASAAKDWQPIATAPKDGTEVLLGWFELPGMNSQRVGFWHSREHAWCDTHHVLHNQQSPPTHWQPLPDPPSEAR